MSLANRLKAAPPLIRLDAFQEDCESGYVVIRYKALALAAEVVGQLPSARAIMLFMPGCKRFGLGALVGYTVMAILLLAGCQQDISGAYLASDQNAVCWLQLVRTPDNHLTGQLDASVMKPDGSIERDSIPVTGAADGDTVSLTGSRFLGLQSVMLSGTLQRNVLTLTGSQSLSAQAIPVTLTRSSLTEYQHQVSELNARAQGIVRAKAEVQEAARLNQARANFLAQIDQTIANMGHFDSAADVHLARFPGAEKGYEAVTAKVAAYVMRERELAGNPNASVARGQLSVAATQASFATDQMHDQGQSLESALQVNVKPIGDKLGTLEEGCRTLAANTDKLSANQNQEDSAACERLTAAAVPFRQKYAAMAAGLAHLDWIYGDEHGKQQQLLQEAERLQ